MDTSTEDLPTVEELESSLASDATNLEIREELIEALLDRYLFETEAEADWNRAMELLKQAPEDKLLYQRAYIAMLDGDDAGALAKIREAAADESKTSSDPLTSDELWEWLVPIDGMAPEGAYEAIAEGFATEWPNSAAVLTVKGMTAPDDEAAVNFFLEALRTDGNYWLAAKGCADRYANSKDWTKALEYDKRALASELAAESPDIWFDRAICEGKLKLYHDEARSYRRCMEIDPDYPSAKNNLGWALVNAGKSEEAVPLLREAMEQGKDGKYPLRNLAEALRRIGRYEEAIELLQGDLYRGALTTSAKVQIKKLEALLTQRTAAEQNGD